jgi:hypothetical protein
MMTLLTKRQVRGKQLRTRNREHLRNGWKKGNEPIGAIFDLVENNPDKRGLMGDDLNESSDSSSSFSLSTSSTSSSDEETDSEQNTTTKHITSKDVHYDNQGEDDGNSDDGTSNKVDGSVASDSNNADVNDAAASESETLQIQESSRNHSLPSRRNTTPSRSAQLIYHGIFTSFQCHDVLLDKDKSLVKNILLQLQCLKSFPRITIISCKEIRRCYRGVNP